MKLKFISITVIFFFVLSFNAKAQQRRVIRNSNGVLVSNISAHNPNILPQNVTSCTLDTIILTSQAQVNNFSTNYPTCTNPKYLFINGLGANPAITNLSGLSSITQVVHKLRIQNTSVTNLSALSSLTQLDTLELTKDTLLTNIGLNNLSQLGSIVFTNLPSLNSIAGLANGMTSINNIFLDTTALTSLTGLSSLTNINGNVQIDHTPLPNLSSLNNVHQILGWLWLDQDTLMTSIGLTNLNLCGFLLFSNLTHLSNMAGLTYHLTTGNTGTFWIINTPLTNLDGLDSLTSAPNFYIYDNQNMTSLHGLEKLSGDIGSGFSILNNSNLTNISALSGITSTNYGTLELSFNSSLTNLIGLGNVTNIGGALWIDNMFNLTTLNDLNIGLNIRDSIVNTNANIRDTTRLTYNYQLSLCSFQPICSYLQKNGAAYIHDNAPGCNSIIEIQNNCALCNNYGSKTWNGSVDNQWNIANNWTPTGVPGHCDSVHIPTGLTHYPVLANDVTVHELTMDGDTLNLNNYNFESKGSVTLQGATIKNGSIFKVSNANSVFMNGCTFEGNVTIDGYSGELFFYLNTVYGNVIINDSSTRISNDTFDASTVYGNLIMTRNATNSSAFTDVSFDQGVTVTGNASFTVNNPAQLNIAFGPALVLGGNLTINSNFPGNPIVRSIEMNFGGSDAHITKLGSPILNIDYLSVVKSPGFVILDQDVHVTSSIYFAIGVIKTTASKLLILDNNCSVYQNTYSSFVWGPVKKVGNQSITFPIGDSIYKGNCTIGAPISPTDAFTAQYFHKNPVSAGTDTSLHVASLTKVSGKEYWKIKSNDGNSTPQVSLIFDSSRSGNLTSIYALRVARWDTTKWQNEGGGGVTGNLAGAAVRTSGAENKFGLFTLGFAPVYIPIITLSPVDSVICHYVPFGQSTTGFDFTIHFTVDSLMFTDNTFTVKLSDSSGNFTNSYNIGFVQSYHSDSISCYIPYNTPSGNHYRIKIVGSSPLDTSIASNYFSIRTTPVKIFSIIGPAPACLNAGISKYYASQKENGATYLWNLTAGGTMSTLRDTAYVTWNAQGTYYLSLSTSNYCGSGPSNSLQVVTLPPKPSVAPIINNSGRWIYSTPIPANQNILGIHWFNNNVLINGATGSSYYASAAGNFTNRYYNYCGNGPASDTITFAASSIPQTINFPSITNKTYGDPAFIPNATSSSGLPVSFSIANGPATVNNQTNFLTMTGTGSVTVVANQPGSNTYDTAAPSYQTFSVNKATQLISFAAIPDQSFGNTPLTLNATASSGLIITYTVFSGPAVLSGNQLTSTGAGTIIVKASQNGDTNYLAATPVNRSFCSRVASLNPITGYSNLCPGTATYSVNNVPGATYFWRIVGGSTLTSTTNIANVTWTIPGMYTLLVSATGSCGSPSINDTLVVNVINSIQPDSVHGMLPANGAINQQLPLTLSWVPAQPNAFYTFDVYIWRSDSTLPASPFVSGLTTVNYTIPLNSGLAYNKTYKWMVVAHNGSCTIIHTGPVQQFSLIPLPDLVVSNVQIPSTAFSGQPITINWKVTNAGPGRTTTNQGWTDAVFFSFDTLPYFTSPITNAGLWNSIDLPIRPLLVGTKPNVTALDSGQFYTNSLNFTLPLNYSQPLYAYVIANYPAGTNAPLQITYANDTARAPQPIAVTLSPTPDLRVDTVFTPNSTFSGSTINITYKVKNYGALTPATSNWADNIYISQNPFFNINSATLLTTPKFNNTYYPNPISAILGVGSQLQTDSFYTKNLQVVIPNYIFGTYFIYVYTNQSGQLYEGANAGNNTNRSQIQVFLTPTPHLIVTSLTIPVTTASTTQSIGVSWNVGNTGFNDNIEKNKGHYYVYSGSCTFPPPPCPTGPGLCIPGPGTPGILSRDSVGFGGSFWKDKVYLSTDSTGLNTSTALLLSTFYQGQQYSGSYVSDYYNMIYGCQQQGTNLAGYNVNTFHAIKPGGNYPFATGFVVPDYLPQGNYYVYVLTNADKDVFEYPGLPESRRSALPITVQRPDATVTAVTAPANATGGQGIVIQYNVLNIGPGAVYNHYRRDNFYISASPVFNNSAQLISTQTYTEDLTVGTAVQHAINYTFPVATSGQRYIFIHTNFDSAFKETNSNNNISTALQINVSPAIPNDLVVSSVQVADSIFTLYPDFIKYTVQNNGPGQTAGVWTDSIFISCSATFNPATSYYVGKRSHNEVVPGSGSYTDSGFIVMPFLFNINNCFPQTAISTAYFYVKTNADNIVYESNTNNNVTGSGAKIVINPLVDHIVTTVNGPDTANVGRPYLTTWTVKNIGYNAGYQYYYAWYDAVYFSTDSIFNNNAVQASPFFETTPLNRNLTYSDTKYAIPPNIPSGDYYVFVNSNFSHNIYAEIVYANNFNLIRNASAAAKKIHVVLPLLPDLTDSIITAPATVAIGQPINVITSISNKGTGVTYPNTWSDRVWLSTDFIPGNGSDILLSGINHVGVLQPNQYYNDTTYASIPLNTIPGNYILISQVNATGNVFESNLNNNLSFKYITVYSPAPSDLIVEGITKPDTVYLGYTLDTAKWIIKNNSPNTASGVSSDGIYISKNTTLDSTAVLLGIKNKYINMGPLSRDTIAMQPLVNNVVEGSYNVLVRTDLLNNIVESDKTNNINIAMGSVYVAVKQLPLNVLTPNTLYVNNRIYKLIIPDSLSGSTIQVVLKTGDSLSMKNQMFIGKGYVPSAANFDYTYNTPNYGNQQIIITSVTAGFYYITIRCVSPNPVIQNITLKAVKLPFTILNVQSTSGGNSGNVTIQINGSLFTPNMTAKLSKTGTTITASAIYFTNSTIVYATFNLQSKPLGIYDVTLIKPDSTTAILTSAFSVVAANNGGLITGGGANTGPSGSGNDAGCDPGAPSGLNSQLIVEMVAPAVVVGGFTFSIQINYNNPTNVDIPAQTKVVYSERNILMALTSQGVGSGNTVLHLELSEQDGPPGIVRAGGSGTITIYARVPVEVPGHTKVFFKLE